MEWDKIESRLITQVLVNERNSSYEKCNSQALGTAFLGACLWVEVGTIYILRKARRMNNTGAGSKGKK